jgi:hypothetical protein
VGRPTLKVGGERLDVGDAVGFIVCCGTLVGKLIGLQVPMSPLRDGNNPRAQRITALSSVTGTNEPFEGWK